MKLVAAFDPGESTGFAIVRAGQTKNHLPRVVGKMVIRTHSQLNIVCMELAAYDDLQAVVVEDFKLYPHMAKSLILSNMSAAIWKGKVEFACWVHALPKPVFQMAFQRKPLLKHPLVLSGGNAHERDAIAHALYYMLKSSPKMWNGRSELCQ